MTETISITIPEDKEEAYRRFMEDPVFHEVVKTVAFFSDYNDRDIVRREGPAELVVPQVLVDPKVRP